MRLMKHVRGLRCVGCGKQTKALPQTYLCPFCGDVLDVEYDYESMKQSLNKEGFSSSPSMWRYMALLPVKQDAPLPPLRVGGTPIYDSMTLAKTLGIQRIILKDEGVNPTASLKDRASALAVVKAEEAGSTVIACASTGNAASSLSGNVASLGGRKKAVIFVPSRAPKGKLAQLQIFGAEIVSVSGTYQETFQLAQEAISQRGWYNRNAAVNPYLVEGKKTVTLELMEQLSFVPPDWVVVSVGDGCTLAGAYKGMRDFYELGLIKKIPRILGVQAAGCAPITSVFHSKEEIVFVKEETIADSIAVGAPRNYKKALHALTASEGTMINVTDEEILSAMGLLGRTTGIFGEPAGVAGLAGLKKAVEEGLIAKSSTVAVIITGNGLKDIDNALKVSGAIHFIGPTRGELTRILKEVLPCS